ncbi:DUF4259 domain-containing protein [Actinomadura rudentiformis]|uniref:DUF4259 domain-containing protein n=1 Tax=Actinomadura rudentiformis TaxID=359158 RepID=A0A6H9YCK4_9ACTN|nr:DUF4259 domain-containing protein [Actinomadura rudentiformis]KAB2341249.1 DUF4259 domain-containing protein [Actinomadura rudentiformis]
MGAWGIGPFENDGAMDLIGELEDADGPGLLERLREAMTTAIDSDEVENPEMQEAVAAAALVGLRQGAKPDAEADPNVAEFLKASPFEVTAELRGLAARTFDRAFNPAEYNEWHELWAEVEELEAVEKALAPYRSAVTGK